MLSGSTAVSDAWERMLTYSSADEGSDAWTHLISQEGGGAGEMIHIGPTLDADVPVVSLSVDMATVLSANLVVDEVSASVDTALTTSTQSTILEADVCQQ